MTTDAKRLAARLWAVHHGNDDELTRTLGYGEAILDAWFDRRLDLVEAWRGRVPEARDLRAEALPLSYDRLRRSVRVLALHRALPAVERGRLRLVHLEALVNLVDDPAEQRTWAMRASHEGWSGAELRRRLTVAGGGAYLA